MIRVHEFSATSCLRGWGGTGKPELMPKARSASADGFPFPGVPQVIFANWREAQHRTGLSAGVRTVCELAPSG